MSDQEPKLPVPANSNELIVTGTLLGIPKEIVDLTLESCRPALESIALLHGDIRGDLWFAKPQEPEPVKSSITVDSSRGNISYRRLAEGRAYATSLDVDFDTFWARTKEELEEKIAKRSELEASRDELVGQHPLKEGGLILSNGFGGIDPYDVEATARHLVLRSAIAKHINARTSGIGSPYGPALGLVRSGLLNPLLGLLVGRDFVKLVDNVSTIIDAVDLLPVDSREQAAPALLEGALAQSREFVEENKEAIIMAANISSNTILAGQVLEQTHKLGGDPRSTWQRAFGKMATSKTVEESQG